MLLHKKIKKETRDNNFRGFNELYCWKLSLSLINKKEIYIIVQEINFFYKLFQAFLFYLNNFFI